MSRRLLVTPNTQWADAGGYLTQDGYNQIRELFDRVAAIESLLGIGDGGEGNPILGPYQIITAAKSGSQFTEDGDGEEVVTDFSVTITPLDAANRINIRAVIPAAIYSGVDDNAGAGELRLYAGASLLDTQTLIVVGEDDGNAIAATVSFDFWHEPGNTDPVTYSFTFEVTDGSGEFEIADISPARMTVLEYGA